jgi:branched-chain amino acid transport system permease protein
LTPYPLVIWCHMLVFAIACLGVNLLFGTAGSLSLGHGSFFGMAAYTGTLLVRFQVVESLEAYLASAVASATLFAAAAGLIVFRTAKMQFAILTLVLSMVMHAAFFGGAIFRLLGPAAWVIYLEEEGGLYLPRLTMLAQEIPAGEFVHRFSFVVSAAFLASLAILWRIGRSPFGHALRAIRDNETRALFIGIPVRRYRWIAFTLSGLFVGLAGGLYGQLAREITPEQLHWIFSAQIMLAIVIGGSRFFLGPVVGAFTFVVIDALATRITAGRSMIFGALLIAVVMLFPQGMSAGAAPLLRAVRLAWHRRLG